MGQLDCLHLLLLTGADAGKLNDAREMPVDMAVTKRHNTCVTLLRRHRHTPLMPAGYPSLPAAFPAVVENNRSEAPSVPSSGGAFPTAVDSRSEYAQEAPSVPPSGDPRDAQLRQASSN